LLDYLLPGLSPQVAQVTRWGLRALGAAIAISSILTAFGWFMNGLQRYDIRAIFSIAGQSLFVAGSIVAVGLGAGLAGVVASQTLLQILLPAALCWVWVRWRYGHLDWRLTRGSLRMAWTAMAIGFSTMIFITGYQLSSSGIGLIVGKYHGAKANADFTITLQLMAVAIGMLTNASRVMRPVISTLRVQGIGLGFKPVTAGRWAS